jgi:tellurite resistance protein TehA-like permease
LEGDGEIVYITEGKTNIFRDDGLKRDIEMAVENMKPTDYLLIAGNSVIASYCTAIIMKKLGCVNLLIWDYHQSKYREGNVK